jgi:AraC family transcriptional regulator
LRIVFLRLEIDWFWLELRMDLKTHGASKYTSSRLLGSSSGRGWRGVFAELRSHAPCDTAVVMPRQTEITLAVSGSTAGYVTRKGAGMRQQAMPVDGTLWLSPVGVDDNAINIAAPLPQTLHLFLSNEPFARLAEEYNLPRSPERAVHYAAAVQDDVIRQIGMSILGELRAPSAAGDMLVETGALMLAARLAQSHSEGYRVRADERRSRLDPVRLRRTLDYIDAHLDDDISVDVLARQCYLSAYHFTRMFSAATGMPPYRYVARLRLEKAKRLLMQGQLPLCEIAQIARFASQASFTRAFSREMGISPARFRAAAA